MSKYFSIIMPVYNSQQYLREAIESVLFQSFKDIELLIIDDNSTDNSYSIINEYLKKDDRIKYFRNECNKNRSDDSKKINARHYKPRCRWEKDRSYKAVNRKLCSTAHKWC